MKITWHEYRGARKWLRSYYLTARLPPGFAIYMTPKRIMIVGDRFPKTWTP